MFYLDVATDGRAGTLCFASKNDAVNFADFVKVYVDDSGVGNGYDAYWLNLDAKPYWRPYMLSRSGNELDPEIITKMICRILIARLATDDKSRFFDAFASFRWSWGQKARGIVFQMDPLPPRQRPTVGDMYRIPRSKLQPSGSDVIYSEGRVLDDFGEMLLVRACQDEDPSTGEWRNGKVMIYHVAARRTMKIHDWLSAMRQPASEGKE